MKYLVIIIFLIIEVVAFIIATLCFIAKGIYNWWLERQPRQELPNPIEIV